MTAIVRHRIARMWSHAMTTGWVLIALQALAGAGVAYDVIEVRNGGAVDGSVRFTGTPPAPKRFAVRKGADVCGTERVLTKLEVHQGMVRGVIVALEGVEHGKPFPSHHEQADEHGHGAFHYTGGRALHLRVDLHTCSFGPFTGVVMADEAVHVVNHDPIRHTLHTYALHGRHTKMLKTVDARILGAGSRTHTVFPTQRLRRARAVAFTCDRHDFMENWLYLARNPYYAVSDKAGRFEIDQVPPGDYVLTAWHPVLGIREQPVTIAPHGRLTATFTFTR